MFRWILRVFLVLLLVATVWIACRSWQRRTPEFHWQRAQEAVDSRGHGHCPHSPVEFGPLWLPITAPDMRRWPTSRGSCVRSRMGQVGPPQTRKQLPIWQPPLG